MKRDFIDLSSISAAEAHALLSLASWLKSDVKNDLDHPSVRGKTLAMLFQKPSLRTRLTF